MNKEGKQKPSWPDEWSWGVFTIGDVIKILSIKRRKILLYVEKGVMKPSIPAEGRGVAARFSVTDLIRIGVIQYLDGVGIAIRYLQPFVERLEIPLSRGEEQTLFPGIYETTVMESVLSSDPLDLQKRIEFIYGSETIRMFALHEEAEGAMGIGLISWLESVEVSADHPHAGTWESDRGFSAEDTVEATQGQPVVIVVNLGLITYQVLKQIRTFTQSGR
ncbi:MAG: MerR family transcriptional regulator [Gemmatimonadetes bacterium]|jgi:DNA-binding transcriptional MerR regulator|nr:MerR family transcriptional regulator [Gemmatimonadota bacterium]